MRARTERARTVAAVRRTDLNGQTVVGQRVRRGEPEAERVAALWRHVERERHARRRARRETPGHRAGEPVDRARGSCFGHRQSKLGPAKTICSPCDAIRPRDEELAAAAVGALLGAESVDNCAAVRLVLTESRTQLDDNRPLRAVRQRKLLPGWGRDHRVDRGSEDGLGGRAWGAGWTTRASSLRITE